MNRQELEHAIRAACAVAGDTELIIVGSQAILGAFPTAPAELRQSREVDAYPKNRPEAADRIDALLGELSEFHHTHGFYVHGIDPATARLPAGWENRVIAVYGEGTGGNTGWCLEPHDLAASKLVVPRDKDLEFVTAMAHHGLIRLDELRARIAAVDLSAAERKFLDQRLTRIEGLLHTPRG